MYRIQIIADEFFKKCGIKSLPISQNKLISILEENGWELYYYSKAKNIINDLELNEYCNTLDGFTYIEDDKVVIFIKDNLSYMDKINVICHEIGHIVLGHTSFNGILGKSKDKDYENILEKEADTFSLEFQAPIFMLIQKKYDTAEKIFSAGILDRNSAEIQYRKLLERKDKLKPKHTFLKYKIGLSATILMSLMLLVLSIALIKRQIAIDNKKSIQLELITIELIELTTELELITESTESSTKLEVITEPTTESEIVTESESNYQSDKVIITKSGKKYHLPNCFYVANKTGLVEVSKEDASEKGYTPCSKCNP